MRGARSRVRQRGSGAKRIAGERIGLRAARSAATRQHAHRDQVLAAVVLDRDRLRRVLARALEARRCCAYDVLVAAVAGAELRHRAVAGDSRPRRRRRAPLGRLRRRAGAARALAARGRRHRRALARASARDRRDVAIRRCAGALLLEHRDADHADVARPAGARGVAVAEVGEIERRGARRGSCASRRSRRCPTGRARSPTARATRFRRETTLTPSTLVTARTRSPVCCGCAPRIRGPACRRCSGGRPSGRPAAPCRRRGRRRRPARGCSDDGGDVRRRGRAAAHRRDAAAASAARQRAPVVSASLSGGRPSAGVHCERSAAFDGVNGGT